LTYAIRAIRAVAIHDAGFMDIWPDLQILVGSGLAVLVAGYFLFEFTERRARRTGSLGRY
jgi:hypothetical protein